MNKQVHEIWSLALAPNASLSSFKNILPKRYIAEPEVLLLDKVKQLK